jgi:hypothetical protein
VIVLQRAAATPNAWLDLAKFESKEDASTYLRTVKGVQLPAPGFRLVRRRVMDEVI